MSIRREQNVRADFTRRISNARVKPFRFIRVKTPWRVYNHNLIDVYERFNNNKQIRASPPRTVYVYRIIDYYNL